MQEARFDRHFVRDLTWSRFQLEELAERRHALRLHCGGWRQNPRAELWHRARVHCVWAKCTAATPADSHCSISLPAGMAGTYQAASAAVCALSAGPCSRGLQMQGCLRPDA